MIGQHYNSGTDDGASFTVERQELRDLLSLIKAGESVLITGGRKLGKTVLLQQVRKHFELHKDKAAPLTVPIFQDLMSLTRPPTATRLFSALSHKVPLSLKATLDRRGVKAECPPAPDAWKNDPSLEFTNYLNKVLNHLDDTIGRTIFIYLLDECEALLGAEETHTLLGNLRALVGPETDHRVKLVVTGFRDLKEYEDPVTGTSPFKNVLSPLPLSLLQKAEFDELVQPLLRSLPEGDRKALQNRMWEASGGHPCVTQTLCRLLTTKFSSQAFDTACTEAINLLRGMAFSAWVERFKPDDHELFRKVLRGESLPEEKPLSAEFLQYCGVLAVKDDKLLAPCGLFNNWYEWHFNQASDGRVPGSAAVIGGTVGDGAALISGFVAAKASITAADSEIEPLALVMKGGGVKGLAYVGALRELEKYYKFDWFIGTSAGAIAAVLLAVGYTTDELEDILSKKNFRDFLDSSIKAPFNLAFKGGLFEARSFTTWLDKLIGAKIKSFEPLSLEKITKRVTIYASRRYRRALVFDKAGPRSDTYASFAVRCSMSIPLVFTPQRDQGLRVLDGGMQNNYPLSDLLANSPETRFIGLYLGNYYEGMPKEPTLFREMISIWTEAVDAETLEKYQLDTVIIDPRPISTINFNLDPVEKDFLLKVGRASALRFLLNRRLPNGPTEIEVEEAEAQAQQAKAAAEVVRSRRRKRRWLILALIALIVGGAWFTLRYINT
jgi:predicted acylesterase/phospholipase RssA